MNFQQLRTFRELTTRGFSLSAMASVSRTSQPGLTRQIRDFESELGLAVFERSGNRIVGLSDAGRAILKIVDRLLCEADKLLRTRNDYENAASGTLTIATTHTQARYMLPASIVAFRAAFPNVRIELRHSSTEQVARLVMSGAADIGIAGDPLASYAELATFPCHGWRFRAAVPDGHPLLGRTSLTLADLAAYPILTYERGLGGRRQFDDAFAAAGIAPDIVLTSTDADVIKQYVAMGLGVGLVAPMAFSQRDHAGLHALDTGTLFAPSMTLLAVRRGAYIRSYSYEFIARFLPGLTRARLESGAAVAHLQGTARRGARTSDLSARTCEACSP